MEITAKNFLHTHNVLERDLADCSFVAIDLEFTGIDRADDSDSGRPGTEAALSGADDERALDALLDGMSKTLLATPASRYAHKKEVIDRLTVMQIGLSIFVPERRGELAARSRDQHPSSVVASYMKTTAETIVRAFGDPAGSSDGSPAVGSDEPWSTSAHVRRLLADCALAVDGSLVTLNTTDYAQKLVAQLESHQQDWLAALSDNERAVSTGVLATLDLATKVERIRASECLVQLVRLYTQWVADIPGLCRELHALPTGSGGAPPRNSEAYRVSTFYAGLFPSPASKAFRFTSFDAETLGGFLAGNGMNFNAWIRDGLRFTTMDEYLQHRSAAAHQVAVQTVGLLGGVTKLPAYSALYGARLDALLPLSPAETGYVQFILGIHGNPRIQKSLAEGTAALFTYARSMGDTTPPSPLYMEDRAMLIAEAEELKKLGVTRRGRSYGLLSSKSTSSGSAACAFSDVCGMAGTASVEDTSLSSDYYGTKLLATLLSALQSRGKPLVVHNGYSDLAFLIRTLYGSLPESYTEFKALCRRTFPRVYDTRTITCSPALHHLGNMQGRLERTYKEVRTQAGMRGAGRSAMESYAWLLGQDARPRFVLNARATGGFDPSAEDSELHAHNAAFDAYVTGSLFAFAKEELMRVAAASGRGAGLASGDEVMAPYEGVLPLYGSLAHVNLNDSCTDALLLLEGAPVIAVAGKNVNWFMETMHQAANKVGLKDLSIMYNGSCYVVTVCTPEMSASEATVKLDMAIATIRLEAKSAWVRSLRTVSVDYEIHLHRGPDGAPPQLAYLKNC